MLTDYYRHIRSRFITAVAIVVLVLAGLFYFYSLREYNYIVASAEKRSASNALLLEEFAEQAFLEADGSLKDLIEEIGKNDGIRFVRSGPFQKLLNERVQNELQFSAIFVIDKQGNVAAHSNGRSDNINNYAERPYFVHHRDNASSGLYISPSHKKKDNGAWHYSFSRQLKDASGRFAGIVVVVFETGYFDSFYKAIDTGYDARVILASSDGYILVHEPFSEKAFNVDFKNTLLFTKYLPSAPSGTYHVNKATLSQTPRIISYAKLPSFPVVSIVSYDYATVVAPWLSAVYTQAAIGGLLLLLFSTLSYLFLGQVKKLGQVNLQLEEQQVDLELKVELLDAASDAIILLDTQGQFVYFNNALQTLSGYSREELLQRGLHGIEPPEYAARIQANINTLLEQGESFFESAYLRKSGMILPIEVHARITNVGGRKLVLSMVRDISERKEIEYTLVNNITNLKKAEQREKVRAGILERIASGEPLPPLLSYIAVSIEAENPEMLCSILLVSDDGKRLLNGAAPSLPDFYNTATNRTRIGEGIGSCGTAAFQRERVIVEDIDSHPFWKGFKPAQDAGLRSCWSEPIISSTGILLGTFAIYHRYPATPGDDEISLIQQAAAFAGIAIERSKGEAERLGLEQLLSQSQKMEAIGHLSGGIAHDFNNLLTPILIYSDMLKRSLPDNEKVRSQLDGIVKASKKARDLTQQLLSFGRKQVMQMHVVDLNEVTLSFHAMVRRMLRENININLHLAGQETVVRADSAKIEQVLLNLVLNAQDAISGNGDITIETGQVLIDDEFARRHPGMEPGRFVLLSCTDNGCGMSAATLTRIFEPFFSTKEVGHGTGLGLANVYGIIKQHNGYIMAVSTVGVGTTFNIYLPVCNEKPICVAAEKEPQNLDHTGSSVILLVEDNEMVRVMSSELLEGLGYTVYSAEHPERALEMLKELTEKIDLVITDIVMPGMNGQQLFEKISSDYPEINKVLYMSGYTNNVIVTEGELDEGLHFLQKPFTVDALMTKVKELLGAEG